MDTITTTPATTTASGTVPTAAEYLKSNNMTASSEESEQTMISLMIGFANMHVTAALLEAAIKARIREEDDPLDDEGRESVYVSQLDRRDDYYTIKEDSILNAYDLNNIK